MPCGSIREPLLAIVGTHGVAARGQHIGEVAEYGRHVIRGANVLGFHQVDPVRRCLPSVPSAKKHISASARAENIGQSQNGVDSNRNEELHMMIYRHRMTN